jgi:hypothetical protein
MVTVDTPDKLISFEARKKMGIPNQYGHLVYGIARYGEKNDYAGIYQIRHTPQGVYPPTKKVPPGRFNVRMRFYVPTETALRIANPRRGIFANAVLAWQGLSASEKEYFRLKSFGKHMSGYNVFLHEYLISH